ncbi:3'-5' exonuclease [Corynebacterium sp. AOP40-9SA-29]|uniref:3'-5' exonuclease n=1 Tax=Corynebacterium sp. AOP40-9SA-29 TaxID=3457677 RepID=UPI0040338E57
MRTHLEHELATALSNCVVIDCETTGLDPGSDRIIEFAALSVVDGAPAGLYHSLVSPERSLSREISELTGINDETLNGTPTFDQIADDVASLLGDRVVVGHNISFDIAFVDAEFQRQDRDSVLDAGRSVCTAATARELLPRSLVGRYRLANLAEALSLEHRPSHRAVDDVLATADLLTRLHAVATGKN